MTGSLRNLMFKLHISVVKIKVPQATYHTIVPSTEELYCLNNKFHRGLVNVLCSMSSDSGEVQV